MLYEIFVALVLVLILYLFWNNSNSKLTIDNVSRRRVLITGCDAGFGRLLTKRLDGIGMHVYSGCLEESSITDIEKECSSRVKGVQLDVTNINSIQSASKIIEEDLNGQALWGIVNNAGIPGTVAPFEILTLDDFKKVFDVNFFGIVSVTKQFLPLLRRGHEGRIVMVSSMLGRLSLLSEPYTCSKHALEGLAGGLSLDLHPFNITTHILNPTFYKTNLCDTKRQATTIMEKFNATSDHVQKDYGNDYIQNRIKMINNLMSSGRTNFDPLMECFEHVLTALYPKERYSFIAPDSYILVPYTYLPKTWQVNIMVFFRKLSGVKAVPAQMTQ